MVKVGPLRLTDYGELSVTTSGGYDLAVRNQMEILKKGGKSFDPMIEVELPEYGSICGIVDAIVTGITDAGFEAPRKEDLVMLARAKRDEIWKEMDEVNFGANGRVLSW